MKIEIHDVDHDGCAVVTAPAGHRLMLDCGLCTDRPWYPSVTYHGQRVDTLMLTAPIPQFCHRCGRSSQ